MRKVLIANRGEIACRILRACRAEGMSGVAVYAPVDEGALHVALADQRVRIDGAKPVASYLDGAAIVAAALEVGADAVHPGYGFLAENADFAEAVEAAGLTFVGPRPNTIRQMGDKERARDLAREVGVPVLTGSPRFAAGALDGIEAAAGMVGYPLLVKSCAGGGGIGMRVVAREADLRGTVEATQTLAARSFGDGTVFLERYIAKARHVEVQVFGFGDGEAVHLYERECSIQRRFQKIVEESPSPGIDDGLRDAMTTAALALTKAVRYRGAGTLEFIVDADRRSFAFLEMNTRIQVEHPVTEMVTGIDLVRLQLRLAAGRLAAADLPQSAIRQRGHAVEARLCAENPARMFLPAPGRLARLAFPPAGDDLRIETGMREGDSVTSHFDSMIAKVIAHGDSRPAAIARLREALGVLDMGASVSNLGLLRAIVDDPAFGRGETHTDFLDVNKAVLPL